MSDLSKCEGKDCPLKQTCWRYLAPASPWQSYIMGPYDEETKKCDMYWKHEPKEEWNEYNGAP